MDILPIMRQNFLLLLGLAGLILTILGIALGALFLYAVGFIIAGTKINILGLSIWSPTISDLLVLLIIWKLAGLFSAKLERVKWTLIGFIPTWFIWKLFGEFLMAESFNWGMTELVAVELTATLSALTGNPLIFWISAVIMGLYVITHL